MRRAWLVGAWLASSLAAHASAQAGSAPPVTDVPSYDEPSLVPTRSEEQTRRASVISRELAASIERMPGVAEARVHVALPVAPDFARTLASAARAAVLVRHSASSPAIDASAIKRLVAAAVPDMTEGAVAVIEVPYVAQPASTQPWLQVGPWQVAARSAGSLRAALVTLLLLQLLLAALLLAVMTRRRRMHDPAADGGDA